MAITIVRQPEQLQPSMTDGLFYTLSSTKSTEFKYRYIFQIYVNGSLVFSGKSTPNPEGLGVLDISKTLQTYANSTIEIVGDDYIHNTEKFSLFKENETIEYYVKFGEEYAISSTDSVIQYNGVSDTPGSPQLTSETRKAFNGTYPTNIYGNKQDFVSTPYILDTEPSQYQQGLFLTNSPRIVDVSMNDRHTLSFFNYDLGGDLISYGYKAEYNFFDSAGVSLSSTTIDNITTNGGGPLTGITGEGYDSPYVVPSAYTYNVVNVATGPYNLSQSIGIPTNTKYYQVKLLGNNQGPNVGCPAGQFPAYIESCAFGYQLPVCAYAVEPILTINYWSGGDYNADCFQLVSFGGPGGPFYNGGVDYGTQCQNCYESEFPPNEPESAPNIPPTNDDPISVSAISETFQFNIEDCYDFYNNKQLVWKNRYGTFDYYKFSKRKGEGLSIERQTYTQIPVSWGSSNPQKTDISRGLTDYNVSIQESHIVNTGFVNQATMVWLEEVYTSPEVYLIENDGTLFPINITATEYLRKNKGNKEIVNLELTYTYSNNINLI